MEPALMKRIGQAPRLVKKIKTFTEINVDFLAAHTHTHTHTYTHTHTHTLCLFLSHTHTYTHTHTHIYTYTHTYTHTHIGGVACLHFRKKEQRDPKPLQQQQRRAGRGASADLQGNHVPPADPERVPAHPLRSQEPTEHGLGHVRGGVFVVTHTHTHTHTDTHTHTHTHTRSHTPAHT
jgi:hypothetical protein